MERDSLPDGAVALAAFTVAFDGRRFFDAHEILEAFWVGYRGEDRSFYQGLIQAAVALHHAGRGNARGARGVGMRARVKLLPYAPSHAGVDVASYLRRLDEILR
jgi:uncharacterized protein